MKAGRRPFATSALVRDAVTVCCFVVRANHVKGWATVPDSVSGVPARAALAHNFYGDQQPSDHINPNRDQNEAGRIHTLKVLLASRESHISSQERANVSFLCGEPRRSSGWPGQMRR